jgi:hypothetical protein
MAIHSRLSAGRPGNDAAAVEAAVPVDSGPGTRICGGVEGEGEGENSGRAVGLSGASARSGDGFT